MTPLSVFALYPAWAATFLSGFVALRLGRSSGWGVPLVCLTQGVWLTGLILFLTPETTSIGERALPCGMLEAAAFIHAAHDALPRLGRRFVPIAWAVSILVAVVGAASPSLIYGPGLRSAGPLFIPMSVAATLLTVATFALLAWGVRTTTGDQKRASLFLGAGMILGSFGGGCTLFGVVLFGAPITLAGPAMFGATVFAILGTLARESPRSRALIRSGFVYALITAGISSVGLSAFALALPSLIPGAHTGWTFLVSAAAISFFFALPLDPLRQIVVDAVGRRVTKSPIGVRDLAAMVETSETRADQVERLAELGAVVGAVAHEVRNPLGVILAHAKLLERQGASASSVEAIRHEVDRAKKFVDDLLRYGKPRPLDVTDIDVLETVRGASTRAAQAASAEGRVTVTGDDAAKIEADAHALEDIVKALVGNALIATRESGAAVRVLVDRAEKNAVRVVVEDDGPGVPEALEGRLFEAFATGRGRDEENPGTGLGLAIAARWAERLGGTIVHQRPAAGGARFILTLPQTHALGTANEGPTS